MGRNDPDICGERAPGGPVGPVAERAPRRYRATMSAIRRFDGRPARGVPAYRRIVPFVLRGRNESAVYFEQSVDLRATLPWLDAVNRTLPVRATLFHLLLAAIARVLDERPRLNRFVAGRRLYDRDGIWLSFAVKKRMSDDAPLSVVKHRFDPTEPFADMVVRLTDAIERARSNRPSPVDREVAWLLRLPRPVLDAAVRTLRALDYFDVVPRALFAHDPMYASAFVANLGSIGLDAAYHHLFEHGTCPLFVTLGRIRRAPVVTDGDRIEVRPIVSLKFTFDERVEDGLYCARAIERLCGYLEAPAEWAGRAPAGASGPTAASVQRT